MLRVGVREVVAAVSSIATVGRLEAKHPGDNTDTKSRVIQVPDRGTPTLPARHGGPGDGESHLRARGGVTSLQRTPVEERRRLSPSAQLRSPATQTRSSIRARALKTRRAQRHNAMTSSTNNNTASKSVAGWARHGNSRASEKRRTRDVILGGQGK
ncbi:hypothetical protein E2C01_066813 [Portunus trituberculatus]|uniref:Uncharacterized protein n=1 Tax=Portunus trituberculatus TaxID=210409 RepID=A0A5B7HVP6_PORTR|nr:hypothetical protein [Portunus trituberculatus]